MIYTEPVHPLNGFRGFYGLGNSHRCAPFCGGFFRDQHAGANVHESRHLAGLLQIVESRTADAVIFAKLLD
jgi:hypothetical protein